MENIQAQRIFEFDFKKTCKVRWTFTLTQKPEGLVIDNLEVIAQKRGDNGIQGCQGHPKTLAALIRGQAVHNLPIAELSAAGCDWPTSCGQTLAKCLQTLLAEGVGSPKSSN